MVQIATQQLDQYKERERKEFLVRKDTVDLGEDGLQEMRHRCVALVVRYRRHVDEGLRDAIEAFVGNQLHELASAFGLGWIGGCVESVQQ
jgi:hypothetical protein